MVRFLVREPRMPGQDSGKWNEVKYKALLVLYMRRQQGKGAIPARDLAYTTGCDLHSLQTLLTKWVRWRYVSRRRVLLGFYVYWILSKGVRWLEDFGAFLPQDRFQQEIINWQEYQRLRRDIERRKPRIYNEGD